MEIKTKQDLYRNGIRIYDGDKELSPNEDYSELARSGYFDNHDIRVYHENEKMKGRSKFLTASTYDIESPKGIRKLYTAANISFGLWTGEDKPSKTATLPLARLLYIWFYDDLDEELCIAHLDNNALNNNPSNLKQMTWKEMQNKRKGAINHYGLRKRDR